LLSSRKQKKTFLGTKAATEIPIITIKSKVTFEAAKTKIQSFSFLGPTIFGLKLQMLEITFAY